MPSGPRATLTGIGWLSLGVTCFAVIDAIAKDLGGQMGAIQIAWARFAFFLIPLALITPPALWPRVLQGPNLGLNLVRGAIPCVAGTLAALAVSITPLDLFTAVSFAAPLVVTALAGPMLGEHPGIRRWAAVIVGFGGILIIARPWDSSFGAGVLLALAVAFGFAIYQLLTRKLSHGGHPRVMLMQIAVAGFVITSLALPFDWTAPDGRGWALMVLSGLVHAGSHFSFLAAFRLAPASTLAPFIYVQIVGAVALGYLMFGDVPDLTTIAGTAVVIGCGIYIVNRERKAVA
ncbi:MAG: DMT family transporter [Alphaproteobacteria bacterium]